MKGRRRTTIFRPGLMSNLIIYYKLINYKCMDNIMKCTPLGEQKSLWLRKTLLILKSATLLKSQSVAAQTAKNAIFLVWTDFLPCVG